MTKQSPAIPRHGRTGRARGLDGPRLSPGREEASTLASWEQVGWLTFPRYTGVWPGKLETNILLIRKSWFQVSVESPSWFQEQRHFFIPHVLKLTTASSLGKDSREQYPDTLTSVQLLSHVRLFATPWTVAHQASLSITNSRSLLKRSHLQVIK